MPEITKDSLKKLWFKEKEQYRTSEIGSGVQKFCKKVFQCKELYNLKEGALATNDLNRKNEFLEEASKKHRRADVVIFIDSDIIIPVEVERFGNIEIGEKQLFNYQADWVKKYGILTDGYTWRFYNNTIIERTFFIDKILDNPTDFLTFWQEYITPKFYYRSFFEKKGQLKLFEYIPNLDEVREDFFTDITKLIENFKNKLNLKGYFKDVDDDTEREKKAVEITYAYLIQFILYKTLVDNTFTDFEIDWKDRIKSVDSAIRTENYATIIVRIKGISDKISKSIYKRFSDEQEIINIRLDEILEKPKNDIGDVSVWLDILLFINRYNFCNVENEIFGYVYENYLKDLYINEKKGQYFTDPHVVDFMLDQIGYSSEKIKKRYNYDNESISIIDPSCGSGTFLYNATNRIIESFFDGSKTSSKIAEQLVNENVFGLDIAEFPLYLAEMNILMRMLPLVINERYNNPIEQKIKVFKTRDSISEFLDTAIRNTLTDATTEWKKNHGQLKLFTEALNLDYDSYMRDKRDLNDFKDSLENRNKIPRYRFDFVIGNPPYVGYNVCSKQNLLFVKLIQEKRLLMSDVYGVNLNTVPNRHKAYAPKPNLYSFFIALGMALLKDSGKLCFIIPQTILTATDLDVIRYHLAKFSTIEKIISFSGKMFVGRGIKQNKPIPTSSLIFIVSKLPPKLLHQVEVIEYIDSTDNIIRCLENLKKGKRIKKTNYAQKKLLKNVENWNFIKFSELEKKCVQKYKFNSESMDVYRDYDISKSRFGDIFIIDGSYNFPTKKIVKVKEASEQYFDIPVFNEDYFAIREYNYYSKKEKINIAKGGQGYKVFNTRYKVIWHYIKPQKFYYVNNNSNLLPKFQQYCIGSNNKDEIIYLFSLLNSQTNLFIFKKYLKIENEKDILVGVKVIKDYIKVPKIDSFNEKIKNEVIKQTKILLENEKDTLDDYIDFTGILQQKFDKIEIIGNYMFIYYKDNRIKCYIKDKAELFSNSIDKFNSIVDKNGIGRIIDLKNIPIVDFNHQKNIKNYIDDLVFALYFKVKLSEFGFEKREIVQKACVKHKFYKLINKK